MSTKTIVTIIYCLGSITAIVLSALVFFGTEDIALKMLASAIYLKTLSDVFND